ncbi:MAG TPA: polysaccharide biosynthesis tyrosine autokinase [Gammaproteobacteria bacterium]|nr:polysaccharide biosynthesis tyrosine autokinase [Gammaproteobacteria bacterium]
MERIKQALERARAEREGQPRPTPASRKAPVTAEVNYTQTRNVDIPEATLRRQRIVTAFPAGAFTDAYKILRTQVQQRLKENDWNVLAVTSPGTGEGKTLTALNLAASLAMEVDRTVLLIDANLRHPTLHEHLGLPEMPGLADYLLDDTPLSELLIHPRGFDHLTLLPGGRPLPNSAEMLASPKMMHLVEETKSRYPGRIVIFDLPPVLQAADALAFSPYVDAALLVVEEGRTSRRDVERAVELLSSTNVLGTVLNKAGSTS